jgi:hypothetical protein
VTSRRPQIRKQDVDSPEKLVGRLNEVLIELASRLEALEAQAGITVLPEVRFETGGALAPTSGIWSIAAGGVRVTCPFPPSGVILLNLQPARSMTVSSLASDVKWHYAAGPQAGEGTLHIDFVTGLLINTAYVMRLGVTRA